MNKEMDRQNIKFNNNKSGKVGILHTKAVRVFVAVINLLSKSIIPVIKNFTLKQSLYTEKRVYYLTNDSITQRMIPTV